MARTLTSAAFFCLVGSGFTGCMSPAVVQKPMPMRPEGVVAVPMSYPWISNDSYKAAAIRYIKENNPNFDEKRDVLDAAPTIAGKKNDGKPIGDVASNINAAGTTNLKEYRVLYRAVAKGTNVSSSVLPVGATQRPGTMGNGVVPAGGMQPPYAGGSTQLGGGMPMSPQSFGGQANPFNNANGGGIPPTGSQTLQPNMQPGLNSGSNFGPSPTSYGTPR
jgi:hypothetical protein